MKKLTYVLLICLSLVACSGGSKKADEEQVRVIEAELKSVSSPLFFNAFVEPKSVIKVTTPADGTIDAIHFGYGEQVKAGQVLVELSSESLAKDYNDRLVKYLKAKQEYQTNQTNWQSTQELDRFGLVSKNEFESAKNKLADSTLSKATAKQDLEKVLETLEISDFDFDQLDIQNTQDAIKRLSGKVDKIQIKAPSDGIALLPSKSGKDTEKLTVGGPVRKNEVLLNVGDMSGITMNISVNETQIEQIRPEQPVSVSFIAIPQAKLRGKVMHIDTQAQSRNNDNPTFPVQISVDSLNEKQQQHVLVGMSAKLKLEQRLRQAIMVPIEAVYQKGGKNFVDLLAENEVNAVPTEVRTGPTNLNEVAIIRGLKPGDKIEIRRRAEKNH